MGNRLDESIKTVHAGIDIIYDQDENIWRFELDGKERRADSVLNAKKVIDAPPPKEKAPKFERFKAWELSSWSDELKTVEVTSKAANEESWWVISDGSRQKVGAWTLIQINDDNKNKFERIKALSELVRKSNKEIDELKRAYKRIEMPKD